MKINTLLLGIFVMISLAGCGMVALDLQYNPTGNQRLVTANAPKVKLSVMDVREKKIFFRTALGDTDDLGKRGLLKLHRGPAEIIQDGFTQALQTAGCQIFPDHPVAFDVKIIRFLAIDRENNTNTLKSDIALDVTVSYQGKIMARKSILETETRKNNVFKAWQFSVPPLLNDSLSRAIENAVWDVDILLAIEQANGLNTTRADILARLQNPPKTVAVPLASLPPLPPTPKLPAVPAVPKTTYMPPAIPTNSSPSPFQAQHIRGLGVPEVHIENQSSKTITIKLTGPQSETLTIEPHGNVTQKLKSGAYTYYATALGVSPASGTETFNTDYRYTWTFYITTIPGIPYH